jgi:hypothetical protein
MPLQATSGAASYDAFGGGAPAVAPQYIEDVFSTYLYTGTGANQTITNGIDLSTKGGMVWIKGRNSATSNTLWDTARGANKLLSSNQTWGDSVVTCTDSLNSFNANGFSLGPDTSTLWVNDNTNTYASWTFREQAKFFDVVTYTGTGATQTIAHNLGSVPGSIIVKATSGGATNWAVYHRSLGGTGALLLNSTSDTLVAPDFWNDTDPTSTVFTVKSSSATNSNGVSYVAYLFAHNAGGFGLTGTDNVISCGSYTTDGSNPTSVTLGYEPQWLLVKDAANSSDWYLIDNMRGFAVTGTNWLKANTSASETTYSPSAITPTATGFIDNAQLFVASSSIIYIAIRRGPMKVPTDATKVFSPAAYQGNSTSGRVITTSNLPDLTITKARDSASFWPVWFDRLRGGGQISSNNTDAELAQGSNVAGYVSAYGNLGYTLTSGSSGINSVNGSPAYIGYAISRAPSFFDEVCYTGTGSNTTFTHNLGVAPEMVIVKRRSGIGDWVTWATSLISTDYVNLNGTSAASGYTGDLVWGSAVRTSTTFAVGSLTGVNGSGSTYAAYLFATCAGVSKVGSYTGNGSTQTINCGFTGGARFVLIKRTDASGDWYVYDTARGMTVLTDPYLLLNSAAAEVATLGSVTTVSTGFALNATILAAINTNAASYIFLAIA